MENNQIIGKHLEESKGYNDLETPVLITSGASLTPYFVNAEKLCRDTNISKVLKENEKNASAIIEHSIKLMEENKEFKEDIEIIAEKVEELFKKNKGLPLAVSGGLRRDLIFSGPVAKCLGVVHISLYKQESGQSRYKDKVEIEEKNSNGRNIKLVEHFIPRYVVHIADLMTKGSSSYNVDKKTDREIGWIPMLRERGAEINDLVTVVTRLQGGEELLEQEGVNVHSFVQINKDYLEKHSKRKEEAISYNENDRAWTEKYLQENGIDVLVPYFDVNEEKKLPRAQKFMEQYQIFLQETELMDNLKEAVKEKYGKALNEIIKLEEK